MARTKIYTDNEGNRLNGFYFFTDPAIDDYSLYGIESEDFTPDKTVDKEHCFIEYQGKPCNEAIEAARDIDVELSIAVFKNGKLQGSIFLYDPLED